MRNRILAIVAAIAAAAGIVLALVLTGQTPDLAPVQREVTALQHEVNAESGQLAADHREITGMQLMTSGMLATWLTLKPYTSVCSNPDVQSGSRIVTAYYPCTSMNPNG
jgi:hypothetical protein